LGIKYATPSKLGSPDPPAASAVQVFAQFRLTQ
jgi:hypothetical protein